MAHRVIWTYFQGPIPEGMHINHINGDKTDNRLENLEVVTPSENCIHAVRTGLTPPVRSERHARCTLSDVDVQNIRELSGQGVNRQVLAKQYDVSPHQITEIKSGRRRGYVEDMPQRDTLEGLMSEILEWQAATFPESMPASRAEHFRREADEIVNDPTDLEEMADAFLLLTALVDGRDLVGAVRAKLEKNKRRVWGKPDAHGVVEHFEFKVPAEELKQARVMVEGLSDPIQSGLVKALRAIQSIPLHEMRHRVENGCVIVDYSPALVQEKYIDALLNLINECGPKRFLVTKPISVIEEEL